MVGGVAYGMPFMGAYGFMPWHWYWNPMSDMFWGYMWWSMIFGNNNQQQTTQQQPVNVVINNGSTTPVSTSSATK